METKKEASPKTGKGEYTLDYLTGYSKKTYWDMTVAYLPKQLTEALRALQMPTMFSPRSNNVPTRGGYPNCDTCDNGNSLSPEKETTIYDGWYSCKDCERRRFYGEI